MNKEIVMAANILYDIKKKPSKKDTTNWLKKGLTPQAEFTPRADLAPPTRFKPREDLTPEVSTPVTAPVNAMTASAAAPPDSLSDYWGQKIGKTNMPLDQFVQLTGMAANAIAPQTAGGRLGRNLAALGGGAYDERMKREYETPNKLLQRKLLNAQIGKIEKEQPDKWETFLSDPAVQNMSAEEKLKSWTAWTGTTKAKNKWETYNASPEAQALSIPERIKKFTEITGKPAKDLDKEVAWRNIDNDGTVRGYNIYGKLVSTAEGVGKTKTTPAPKQLDTLYTDYLDRVSTGQEDLVNEDGTPLSQYDFKRYLSRPYDKIPTQEQLAKGMEFLMSYPTYEAFSGYADMLNKFGDQAFTWKFQEAPMEVENMLLPGTHPETVKHWVQVPKEIDSGEANSREAQLRSQLTELKKTDPSVDIEKAMKYYKSIGKW